MSLAVVMCVLQYDLRKSKTGLTKYACRNPFARADRVPATHTGIPFPQYSSGRVRLNSVGGMDCSDESATQTFGGIGSCLSGVIIQSACHMTFVIINDWRRETQFCSSYLPSWRSCMSMCNWSIYCLYCASGLNPHRATRTVCAVWIQSRRAGAALVSIVERT